MTTCLFNLQNIHCQRLVINGNMNSLTNTMLPIFYNVTELKIQNWILYEQILDRFPSLTTLTIQSCSYNASANFLKSEKKGNITTLKLIHNELLSGKLPEFSFPQQLKSLTIIESQLSTNSLRIDANYHLDTLELELGSYQQFDLNNWSFLKSFLSKLEIRNLTDLVVFPSAFFNNFLRLKHLYLSGSYILKEEDICAFYYYPLKSNITLNTSSKKDPCAQTYIDAINYWNCAESVPCESPYACKQYANRANSCSLISAENQCSTFSNRTPVFTFQSSCLKSRIDQWLAYDFSLIIPTPDHETFPLSIGAIIGLIIGLIVAIAILCIILYCIYRYRQNKNIYIKSEDKYRRKSNTNSQHSSISLTTSKSSGQPLFSQHPNHVTAPALYNVSQPPSSIYHSSTTSTSQPLTSRASISTQATHLYEEVLNTKKP
ncbi:unnamed protein product [Didymodactylos carnosus]|uniref:Uncharacterized protein n=1 Tax=Didymodactylos carnosus TaxID=1234261 RepID=A0A813YAE1_9BILA|nr:unnamed protein product [Didymodactylos carnosus]CAF0881416.1 unnamed protein product [Didymodactylos carnosus]CAF3610837.1 unnamed protein product [Didymodactylos carnosus]CAF3667547.1 unnamed protein product [Didymodactylos carnosus]